MFLSNQNPIQQTEYFNYLKVIGGLSNLFSENEIPYLYYRVAENIFCRSFEADNLSRSDCSADAKKQGLGIGLKTFLNNNGNTFQKVAEFNRDREEYAGLTSTELVRHISRLRNNRIDATRAIHGINDLIYHCVTRETNRFLIFEERMDLVDIQNIRNIQLVRNTILFEDGINQYNFNLSKSTLFKRFNTLNPQILDIRILNDPYETLRNLFEQLHGVIEEVTKTETIILPLYSMRSGEVEAKSGLNQWNAGGRYRNAREVYIPVPSWIHKKFPYFFPDINTTFNLHLPNNRTISAKMCQTYEMIIEGHIINKGKGLMSNPNTDLGEWILEDILRTDERQIVTKNNLNELDIDSVEVRKIDNQNYEIDFKRVGSFDDFVTEVENN
ncbi:MAG: hypothetical protein WBL93_03975 [Lutisporaceae bacterium]